jgi:DNA-binding transcriptional MerR regulator
MSLHVKEMKAMMTVNEVSKLTGVSIRTLQYYDNIGLLKPAEYTESGYRLYDDAALERLQQILLFRELEFPLKDIKDIVTRSDFDRKKALDQQIELLKLRKEHIENLISMCRDLKKRGVKYMDFTAFDKDKLDEYAKRAKEQWGTTAEYKEYTEKSKGRSEQDEESIMADFMKIFEKFGSMKEKDPASAEVQDQVKKLQSFITEHYYKCTNEILSGLGKMYAAGGEFTENINKMGGEGTAEFTSKAIKIFCR